MGCACAPTSALARRAVELDGLARLWREQEGKDPPFTGPRLLLEIKKTAREKDWPIVGELARLLSEPSEQMLCSRSARDLIELDRAHPQLAARLASVRPALAAIAQGLDELRLALERERFAAMDADDHRIRAFLAATASSSGRGLRSSDVQRAPIAPGARGPRRLRRAMSPDFPEPRDQFLSEEDLDLRQLSWDELLRWWDHWLREAQAWNDLDEDEYAHGVFAIPRRDWPEAVRNAGRARLAPPAPEEP